MLALPYHSHTFSVSFLQCIEKNKPFGLWRLAVEMCEARKSPENDVNLFLNQYMESSVLGIMHEHNRFLCDGVHYIYMAYFRVPVYSGGVFAATAAAAVAAVTDIFCLIAGNIESSDTYSYSPAIYCTEAHTERA